MSLAAEILHGQYGSVLFVSNDYACDSTSTTNNVGIIQPQLNNLMVTRVFNNLISDSALGATSDPHR